jgi:hypothetical protein
VHEFTFSVTSKLYLSPSDLPPPDDWPEFPHSSLVLQHLLRYVGHFGLRDSIRTSCAVLSGRRLAHGGYLLQTERGPVTTRKLIVATGASTCPVLPRGLHALLSRFRGRTFHAHYYGDEVKEACRGRRVLIVGGSDSASDIAGDICRMPGTKVHMSIRNGQWFQDRIFGAESPADMFYSRTVNFFVKNIVGKRAVHKGFGAHPSEEVSRWWGHGGSDIDIWQPRCDYLNSIYNKSRDVVRLVSFGLVKPCGRVQEVVEGSHIRCAGVRDPFPVDVIILATGYSHNECMLDLSDAGGTPLARLPRFKHVFPCLEPQHGGADLAFLGYIRPYLTSIPMLIELQARWVSQVFSGRCELPPPPERMRITMRDAVKQAQEFPCHAARVSFIVDPYDYADALAGMIGARPDYLSLLLRGDWTLLQCLALDSWNHFAYRLNDPDPGKRELARQVILRYHSHTTCKKIRATILALALRCIAYMAVTGLLVMAMLIVWVRQCH